MTLVTKALDLMNCQWQNALAIGKEKPNTKKLNNLHQGLVLGCLCACSATGASGLLFLNFERQSLSLQ